MVSSAISLISSAVGAPPIRSGRGPRPTGISRSVSASTGDVGRSVGMIGRASIIPVTANRCPSSSIGSAVAKVPADEGKGIKLKRHGILDEYSLIAPPQHLYADHELDGDGIRQTAETFLKG
ncbi:hypothetical protein [Oceaniglobus indicus]|uniref:hypothetical protein n=1 Tax=Oceaniglobus indicus TaxID=2047749 RepID=UPI0019D4E406|nr:hypothetical protein [Oceaniglobus indicus]